MEQTQSSDIPPITAILSPISSRIRIVIICVMAVTFIYLIAGPWRNTFMRQLGSLAGMHSYMLLPNMIREAPASLKSDYQAQLTSAINRSYDKTSFKPEPLLALIQRHPDNPSAYANFLRCASLVFVTTNREESFLLEYNAIPPGVTLRHDIPKILLAIMDQVAQKGEFLDPDNAYFPFMRSAILFTAHRDDMAIAELFKASQRSSWKEYYIDQVYGQWKINSTGIGNTSPLNLLLAEDNVSYTHFPLLRDAVRIAVYKAMILEKNGKFKQGVNIRNAILHISGLIRTQSNSNYGVLNGVTCSTIAISRPGSIIQSKFSKDELYSKDIIQRLNDYTEFLKKINKTSDIPVVTDEINAGLQTKDTILTKLSSYTAASDGRDFLLFWIFGLMVLLSSIVMYLYGGIAQISLPLMTERLKRPVAFSTIYGILSPGLFILLSMVGLKGNLLACISLVALVVILYVMLHLAWRLPMHDIQQCFINAAATGLISLAILISLRIPVMLMNVYKLPASYHITVFELCSIPFVCVIALTLALSIYFKMRRMSLIINVTRKMMVLSPIIGCTIFVIYTGIATITYINEKSLNTTISQSLPNESIYTAQQADLSLPGPTDWSSAR